MMKYLNPLKIRENLIMTLGKEFFFFEIVLVFLIGHRMI